MIRDEIREGMESRLDRSLQTNIRAIDLNKMGVEDDSEFCPENWMDGVAIS